MSTVTTVSASTKPPEEIRVLDAAAAALPDGELRKAVSALVEGVRAGRELIIAGVNDSITPSRAAQVLGVSRTHLYKVLDSGALPFHTVGVKDRRIRMADLRAYQHRVEESRREAARRTARPQETWAATIDEM